MKLLVLAGGFGTRLRSVVSDLPKALAPVGSVPFLRLQIEHWKTQGLRSFVFLLHHHASQIIEFLQNEHGSLLKDCQVHWLIEPLPMGTGGAVAHAVEQLGISGDFLVTNADTWLGEGVMAVRQASSPAMAVVHVQDTGRYGSVLFDNKGFVSAFREKSTDAASGWINAGMCQLNARLFKDWNHEPFSLETINFPAWVANGVLKAVPLETDFIDIGVPADYFRFCRWIESQKASTL